MENPSSKLIQQRLLMRGVINLLAEPLSGEKAEAFLSSEEERLNASLPHPGKTQMKATLKIVD